MPSVTSDNLHGGKLLTDYLVSLGHRKIAFYSGVDPSERATVSDRFAGYLFGLKKANISPDPRLIYTQIPMDKRVLPPLDMKDLMSVISNFLKAGATAIICEHDKRAYYIMDACKRLGIRIPEDISICGFDNSTWAHMDSNIQLTTIEQNWGKLGSEVARLAIEGLSDPIAEHSPIIVPVNLVQGTTTCPPSINDRIKDIIFDGGD